MTAYLFFVSLFLFVVLPIAVTRLDNTGRCLGTENGQAMQNIPYLLIEVQLCNLPPSTGLWQVMWYMIIWHLSFKRTSTHVFEIIWWHWLRLLFFLHLWEQEEISPATYRTVKYSRLASFQSWGRATLRVKSRQFLRFICFWVISVYSRQSVYSTASPYVRLFIRLVKVSKIIVIIRIDMG